MKTTNYVSEIEGIMTGMINQKLHEIVERNQCICCDDPENIDEIIGGMELVEAGRDYDGNPANPELVYLRCTECGTRLSMTLDEFHKMMRK